MNFNRSSQKVSTRSVKEYRCGTLTYSIVGLIVLFAILLIGDFLWQLRDRSVGTITRIVLKNYDAGDMFVAIIITTIPNILALIITPIVSFASDRRRGRLGRRIPFLLWSTPIAVVGMLGMAATPYIIDWIYGYTQSLGLSQHYSNLLTFSSFWVIFEFGALITGVMFNGLVNDVVPPQLLGRFFGLFRILSLGAGAIYMYWLVGPSESHPSILFTVVGLMYGIGFTIMCFFVKEGEYPPPAPAPKVNWFKRAANTLSTYAKDCFCSKYYWIFFLYYVFGFGLSFYPINTFDIYFVKQLGVPEEFWGKCVAISYVCSIVLAFPLGILADKWHPLRCGVVVLIFYGIATLGMAYFIHDKWTFGAGIIFHTIGSGVYYSVTASQTLRIFPRSTFAQFQSAAQILWSLSLIILAPVFGWSLSKLVGADGKTDYRWLYVFGGIISLIGAFFGIIVLKMMKRYGGINNYVAPER